MKKFGKIVLFLFAIGLFASCERADIDPNSTHINFENLAVGQKSQYVRWESKNVWSDSDTSFKQTTDTLSLTVQSKDSIGFLVAEEHLNKKAPTVFYYFKVQGDSLYIIPNVETHQQPPFINSVLFSFGTRQYPLKDNGLKKFDLNRWATPKDLNIKELFGLATNFKIMGKTYESAIGYYNGQSVVADGPVIVRLYSKKDGFISLQALGGFAPFGNIYNLIP